MNVISRVAADQWHALDDDQVVGRAYASRRPDGRLFVSADAWHGDVFDRLADAMLADLPRPLYTVVDEADRDGRTRWVLAGFTLRRREWEYVLPTRVRPHSGGSGRAAATSLGDGRPDAGGPGPVRQMILGLGQARPDLLADLDRRIRAEVDWRDMPAEVLPRPETYDPGKYAVAVHDGRYVGLLRLATATRQPRIGSVAVLNTYRRRGIARALLATVLDELHRAGVAAVTAEVHEWNTAATALFDAAGARRGGSNLELVVR